MKASDLRIGNLTRDKINKTSYEINVRSLLYLIECEELEKEISIEPIPLTEEWLFKFGFLKNEDDEFIKGLVCLENRFTDEFSKDIDPRDFGVWVSDRYIMEIRSVHQLQNLYQVLHLKELELK